MIHRCRFLEASFLGVVVGSRTRLMLRPASKRRPPPHLFSNVVQTSLGPKADSSCTAWDVEKIAHLHRWVGAPSEARKHVGGLGDCLHALGSHRVVLCCSSIVFPQAYIERNCGTPTQRSVLEIGGVDWRGCAPDPVLSSLRPAAPGWHSSQRNASRLANRASSVCITTLVTARFCSGKTNGRLCSIMKLVMFIRYATVAWHRAQFQVWMAELAAPDSAAIRAHAHCVFFNVCRSRPARFHMLPGASSIV